MVRFSLYGCSFSEANSVGNAAVAADLSDMPVLQSDIQIAGSEIPRRNVFQKKAF